MTSGGVRRIPEKGSQTPEFLGLSPIFVRWLPTPPPILLATSVNQHGIVVPVTTRSRSDRNHTCALRSSMDSLTTSGRCSIQFLRLPDVCRCRGPRSIDGLPARGLEPVPAPRQDRSAGGRLDRGRNSAVARGPCDAIAQASRAPLISIHSTSGAMRRDRSWSHQFEKSRPIWSTDRAVADSSAARPKAV